MTYSIVARDPATGDMGVASQSHYFALGRVVTWARAGVGVVATQSFIDPAYGADGLDSMAAGRAAGSALSDLLTGDPDRELRQVAFLDASGDTAMFTGDRCVAATGQLRGDNVVVVGNMLANDHVVPRMLEAYESSTGALAVRMLAAMDAAELAGGDARGSLSASLQVVSGRRGPRVWDHRIVDVRVDEHTAPLVELRRLERLSRVHYHFAAAAFGSGLLAAAESLSDREVAAADEALQSAQRHFGDDLEPTFWRGVLLVRAGASAAGSECLRAAVAGRASYRQLLSGLVVAGILPPSAITPLGASSQP